MDNTTQAWLRGKLDAAEASERQATNRKIWGELTAIQREMLRQLVEKGPVWDEDVCSKTARSQLIDLGLASRASVATIANYRGHAVYLDGNGTELGTP